VPGLEQLLIALSWVATLGSGLIAGAFYAFSTFVMKALARRPAAEGIAAMQAINIAVINPLFLGVFLGTAVVCVAAVVVACMSWWKPGAAYAVAGAALYLVGTFLMTMVCNVPLNNSLAAVVPSDPDAAKTGPTMCAAGPPGITSARRRPPWPWDRSRWPFAIDLTNRSRHPPSAKRQRSTSAQHLCSCREARIA
jgi:uncharacterized membrane protein